jgi:CRP-like cAMP-binding protein
MAEIQIYTAGDYLIISSDVNKGLYLLLDGTARVEYDASVIEKGDFVGEHSTSSSVLCASVCKVMYVTEKQVRLLEDGYPEWADYVRAEVSRQLQRITSTTKQD